MKGFGIYVKNDLLDPKHFKAMRGAIWLYLWFLDKMTSVSEEGIGKVLGGKPIKFKEVEVDLGIPRIRYVKYLGRLRSGGYVETKRTPYGLVVTVHKAFKMFKNNTSVRGEMYRNRIGDVSKPYPDVSKQIQTKKTIQDNTMTKQVGAIRTRLGRTLTVEEEERLKEGIYPAQPR